MFRIRMIPLAAVVALTSWSSPARAQDIVFNGSFESTLPVGDYLYFAGQSFAPGWTILSGTVHYDVSFFWDAADGLASVDIDGAWNFPGAFYQDLPTTVGGHYDLRFAIGGNLYASPIVKPVEVFWGPTGGALASLGVFEYDGTGQSLTSFEYLWPEVHDLVATTASTRLLFASRTDPSGWGAVVDAVSVTPVVSAVPEPAAVALLAGGLAALGAIDALRRASRRRARPAAGRYSC